MRSTGSLEFEAGFDAPDPGFVDEAGQVVEVDRPDRRFIIGDVADKSGDIETVGLIADAQAAFELAAILEFDRVIEKEVDLRTIGPVGERVDLAVADRNPVAGGGRSYLRKF